jgi:hypothetical protein
MRLPANVPAEKAGLLTEVIDRVRAVPNLVAVVLGGSYASGMAHRNSDLDVGLFYREAAPFAIADVKSVAESIATPGTVPVVTDFYGWGPWVNGGAWIQTPAGKVDFIYRNLDQVRSVIDEGCRGVWRHDYDQQPPHGFRSIVYFAETHVCIPLHDPEGAIAGLKESVAEYPQTLRGRIVQECLWGAEFSLRFCRTFSDAADVYNAASCMIRVAQYLVQALFALNREYFLSDKYAGRQIEQFALRPSDFMARLSRVLSSPGDEPAALNQSTEALVNLWLETVELTNGVYKPLFDLKVSLP